jgi:uncharacterized protein YaiL (DUF2058 family)
MAILRIAWRQQYKSANRSASGEEAKPSHTKDQHRIILSQDQEIAAHKKQIAALRAALDRGS